MTVVSFLWLAFIILYHGSMCQEEHSGTFYFPLESDPHEGTWLTWPHSYQHGKEYMYILDPRWIKMTRALVESENVHIAVYNNYERNRIKDILYDEGVPLTRIDFYIIPTDDVWMRDTGPIYVKDMNGKLLIEDWGFNGWGKRFKCKLDNQVPMMASKYQKIPRIDLTNSMILEGGSVEVDGSGTLMTTKSSTLNNNRNPGMNVEQFEKILIKYYGVTNFIWLDGVPGLELTDMHIDGFARFRNSTHIVTMGEKDLVNGWEVPRSDVKKLRNAKNAKGVPYKIIEIPLTTKVVILSNGKKLDYRGSYINYYVANTRVLVPNYNDPNDEVANSEIQKLYPGRIVVGIDVRDLYAEGGMIHCVTQQQPKDVVQIISTLKSSQARLHMPIVSLGSFVIYTFYGNRYII